MSNKVVTFLSKLGQELLAGANFVVTHKDAAEFAVSLVAPGASGEFDALIKVIGTAEAFKENIKKAGGNITGAQAAIGAAPTVAQLILESSAFTHLKVQDPDKFQADCAKLAGVWADILNDFHPDGVQVVSVKA